MCNANLTHSKAHLEASNATRGRAYRSGIATVVIVATIMAGQIPQANGQQAGPPPGYYDIPAGFDFPADKQTLERYRSTADIHAQRLHVWNVFAGMTQPTSNAKYAIWETWYSEDETFQTGPTPQGIAPRRVFRHFKSPTQFQNAPGTAAPQAAGSALLSFVLYNYPAYNHVRSNGLYSSSTLQSLQQTGALDGKIPANRTVPLFPANAVSLKTVWWPVAKDKATPMPVWDPQSNPQKPGGNPFTDWARVVVIDPTNPNVPPNATANISFNGTSFPNSHVVGLEAFHYVVLDAQTVTDAMQHPRIASAVQLALGRALQPGDYAVFVGTHLTTKEIDDWVWATFWWHDQPNSGPFAADRPGVVKGVWRNYLMTTSYDLNLPHEQDNSPHIAFNPYLEGAFRSGLASNCMNCHNRASFPNISFLPIHRGDPDLQSDLAYAPGRLRTDFLWSIPDNSSP